MPGETRQRLSWQERHNQLLAVAWDILRTKGVASLTLGHLAQEAGVTKPVAYDHFISRNGLLTALYKAFDTHQTAIIEQAMEGNKHSLEACSAAIANGYVDCVLAQRKEIPGLIAALGTAPELEEVKRECKSAFLEKCRDVLSPFSTKHRISPAGLQAMLGAAEGLSYAAVNCDITDTEAKDELRATIMDMVTRKKTGE